MSIGPLLAAVTVAVGYSVGLAAPAQADPGTDQQFVNALKEQGVPVGSDADAVGLGNSTCDQLRRGDAPLDVLQHVESVTKWSQDASIRRRLLRRCRRLCGLLQFGSHSTCALLERGGTGQEAVSHVGRSDALRHYPNSRDRELKNLQAFSPLLSARTARR